MESLIREITNGCVMSMFSPCLTLLTNLRNRNNIYPLQPILPENSEILKICSKVRIRIIHVKPEKKYLSRQNFKRHSTLDRGNPIRTSLSEEYWFTRCNKPLRLNSCNCSFRRSQRLSNNFNEIVNAPINTNNVKVTVKIVNTETYIERLIQETFLQAFQEYFVSNVKREETGVHSNSTEDINGVQLRHKHKEKTDTPAVLEINESITSQESQKNKYTFTQSRTCGHAKEMQKEKPLILLFHGIGSCADVWQKLINSLANNGHEVVAPDMLGHGYSSTPNKSKLYSFKNLLNNAVAIFDHYVSEHASQSCIIIAHSFGCSLATALYRFRSQQILQLILISGGGPTPLAASVRDHELSPFNCAELFLKPLLVCGLKRRFFYPSRGKHFVPCVTDHAVPNVVINSIALGQNWPEGDAAYHRRILIPTLLVHGLQDTYVTLVQECEMERTIPRAFLELIPDAGHMVMLDTPEQLAHMILCFIDWWIK